MSTETETRRFETASEVDAIVNAIHKRGGYPTDNELVEIVSRSQATIDRTSIGTGLPRTLGHALVRAAALIPQSLADTARRIITGTQARVEGSSKRGYNEEYKAARSELQEARLRYKSDTATTGAIDDLDPVMDLTPPLHADEEGNLVKSGDDTPKVIANFLPRISERVNRDDGDTVDARVGLAFYIAAHKERPRYRVNLKDVRGDDLLDWQRLVNRPELLTHARVEEGSVSASNQILNNLTKNANGTQIPTRTVFTHLGWSRAGDFITHRDGVEIDVGSWGKLKNYALPPEDVRGFSEKLSAKKVVELLHAFPRNPVPVTVATLAAFAAPLTPFAPLNAVVCFSGRTGSGKSTMAVILSRFFGPFLVDTDLPGTFEGTLNAIEKLMYICKDVPVVLDDLVKGAGPARIKAENLARQIINTVAERTGRTRLRHDLTERQTFTPRGVVVFTMEDQIEGHSGMARTIDVEFNVDDWDHATIHGALTELGPYLPHAMRYFITWMKTTPGLKARFLKHKERVREGMNEEGTHGRTSDNLAHLMAVGDVFCEWLKHAGIDADGVNAEITESIKTLQHGQVAGVAATDPMLGLMRAIAENRDAWFATLNPHDYEHASRDSDTWEFNGDERDAVEHRQDVKEWKEGKRAGWVYGGNYLIRPRAFHAELNEHYRRSGATGFPLGPHQTAKQICDKGYARRSGAGATARTVRIDGIEGPVRVIVIGETTVARVALGDTEQ